VLVAAVIELARSNCVNRLLLDVADNNAPAIALYMRKGFERNGEVSTLPLYAARTSTDPFTILKIAPVQETHSLPQPTCAFWIDGGPNCGPN
jgi:ribosomal protein S18 acetylase RimI-like enzyme